VHLIIGLAVRGKVTQVQVLDQRCAGIDVHKDQVTVAVRRPGSGPGGRETQARKFGAFYGVLREMVGWLVSQGVTHVAMEATGTYTMPVHHALLEPGVSGQVLVRSAAHVKNVPGRKTDAVDASWLAGLLECGLLKGSFIPPEDIKAVRDVIRYRGSKPDTTGWYGASAATATPPPKNAPSSPSPTPWP
jgi:transposase